MTNYIIIPAPPMRPLLEPLTPSPMKEEEGGGSSQEKANEENVINPGGTSLSVKRKRYPKDDYQKNITINVVKCCIREILCYKYKRLLEKRCDKGGVSFE